MQSDKIKEILQRESGVVGKAVHIRFYPAVIAQAHGAYVYDVNNRKYLDFNAAWAVANIGYGHPEIMETAIEQYKKLSALSFTSFSNETIVKLAEKLTKITPGNFKKKVIFGHSGSDANDGVFKLVPYFKKKPRMISFIGGYHGQTRGSYSLSGHKAQSIIPGSSNVVKVPYPYGYRCPFKGVDTQRDCEEAVLDYIENYVLNTIAPPETVAGVIVEPIQSDGGDIVPTPYFLKDLRRITEENDIMLIVDEVKIGMGRTGRMFGVEHSNIVPDVVVLGKPLAAGLPLSAIIMPSEAADCLEGSHLFTLAPQPVAAAAALKTIEVLIKEKLVENAAEMGDYILAKLSELERDHEIIGEVRGRGLILGIEIVKDKDSKQPASVETAKIVYRAWELGLLTAYTGLYSNVIELTPPLIITKEQADHAVDILDQAIEDVENGKVPDKVIEEFAGW